ncbi:MAG: PAAR domain-containing protein, partial [Candidatus Eremiobacteraeota bacterium]|nr:PAAR domain-containing protein [Candidatus Eremiobacteraeota bacterium]
MKKLLIALIALGVVSPLAAAAGPAVQIGAPISGPAGPPGTVTGPGVPTVSICGKPAAVAGDTTSEFHFVGPAIVPVPGVITGGSTTVLIGGKRAARAGDLT